MLTLKHHFCFAFITTFLKFYFKDFIFIFEENEEIIGLVLPDGDSFNSSIKKGYEYMENKEKVLTNRISDAIIMLTITIIVSERRMPNGKTQ